MLRAATVQISMELWGAIICLIFAAFIFFVDEKMSRRGRLLLAILLQIFFILTNDTIAWAYRGREGLTAHYAVRISNYLVFILNYVIGFTIMRYLEELLVQRGGSMRPWMKIATDTVCLVGIIIVTVSQFTGYLYTFDAQNLYSRADGYLTICVVAGAMQLLIAGCILSCRRMLQGGL